MENLFISVLNMSLTAAYCAGIVLCIRLCIRRLPKIYSYILWLVVFFRFAVPFSPESAYSLVRISSKSIPADIGLQQMPQIKTGLDGIDATANRIISATIPPADAAASVNPMQIFIYAASWIWLIAAVGLVCYGVVSYCLLAHRLKNAVYADSGIYVAERIPTPFVMGIAKPRIYLTQGLSEKERQYVVSHEQVHLKRYDYLIKQLAFIIVSIHWFNPAAWISLWMLCRDMELSCDEQVLRESGLCGGEQLAYKKDYAAALLAVASGRRIRLFEPLFFDGGNVKGRIQNVLAYKQRGKIVTCVSVILLLLAVAGLAGSQKSRPSESKCIAVTVWRYDAESNKLESYSDIVDRGSQAFGELETLLENYYYKVSFHSPFAENDYLNGAEECIAIKGENGDGFCVRSDGTAAVCKADGKVFAYYLKNGETLFREIEELLIGYDIVYHTTTTSAETEDLNAVLKNAGHTNMYRIPEAYWAGIEGLEAEEKYYPIILGTNGVYDDRTGNRAAFFATIYCVTEDGLRKVGEVSAGGTAYPLRYDHAGIYICSNHQGNRLMIDTETWESKLAESVTVEYGGEPFEKYCRETDGEIRDSDIAEFSAFFDRYAKAVVMDFEEVP